VPANETSASGRRHFRECRRAGATDDQVRVAELPPHVVEERLDVGLNPRRPIAGSDHFHISFSRLMGDTEMRAAGRQLRRCLHHGHVDCVRALRAAKN